MACAVSMQLAMESINEENLKDDLPEVEMGIGIHTGQVVLGNIGSAERMKYGVVGSHVNLTSRIQSYTIGGQVLISEATLQEVGPILKIGTQLDVKAKDVLKKLMEKRLMMTIKSTVDNDTATMITIRVASPAANVAKSASSAHAWRVNDRAGECKNDNRLAGYKRENRVERVL